MAGFTPIDLLLDPIRMIRDIRRELSFAMNIWGPALNFPLMIGGLIYIARPEGVMALVSNLIALIIAGHIHRYRRFSKLIGFCHAAWLPVYPFLVLGLFEEGDPVFLTWLGYSVATMTVSLILDAIGLYRFVVGGDDGYAKSA